MRQMLLVLSMLVSHVICPFQCMGQVTMGKAGDAPTDRCHCCSHCGNDSEPSPNPESDSKRCDCICNGAVLTDSVSFAAETTRTWHADLVEMTVSMELAVTAARHEAANAAARQRPARSLHRTLHLLQV